MLYIFKPNVSQRLFTLCPYTLPRSLPSLSLYNFPLHSPSLSAITLPHFPPPSISLPHPFRSVAVAGTLVSAIPFSNPYCTRHRWLKVCCSTVLLFCATFFFVGNGWLLEGDLTLPKSSIFFHLFNGYDAGSGFV